MIEPIEHRFIRLEHKVADHEEELKELRTTSKELSLALHGIEKTLHQIKWLALGGSIVMLIDSLGVEKVLQIIVGVF